MPIGKKLTEQPAISKLLLEKGELVIRTFLGKAIPDFDVASTEVVLDSPASMTATYFKHGRRYECQFLFYDHPDEVAIDGDVVQFSGLFKKWVYACSTGFVVQNYDKIEAMLKHVLEQKQQSENSKLN